MLRSTKYEIKKIIVNIFILVFIGHFVFSNFVLVIPSKFHIIFYRTQTSDTRISCPSPNDITDENSKKGFPFSVIAVNNGGPCDDSNQWLLAGFLNAAYLVVGTLFLLMVRFNILE